MYISQYVYSVSYYNSLCRFPEAISKLSKKKNVFQCFAQGDEGLNLVLFVCACVYVCGRAHEKPSPLANNVPEKSTTSK